MGRVGRAHGIKGDVAVEVRTDVPDERFAPGTALRTDRGPLTVTAATWHSGRLLLRFAGVDDRTAAEALRGVELRIAREDRGDAGPEAWWDEDLVGLEVRAPDGTVLGEVTDVVHSAQDLLAVTTPTGHEALVPFVSALVPTVAADHLVVDAPDGLFSP